MHLKYESYQNFANNFYVCAFGVKFWGLDRAALFKS